MAHIIAQALQKKSDPNSVGLPATAAALGSSRPVSISGNIGFTLVLGALYREEGDIIITFHIRSPNNFGYFYPILISWIIRLRV